MQPMNAYEQPGGQGAALAVCDQRSPQGYGPIITLLQDRLMMQSRGALGGGLHEEIPIHAMVGFYAVTYQYRSVTGGDAGGSFDQFLVAWRDPSGNQRVSKWMIDVRLPAFEALLRELARLRPDASLLHLPSREAHRALGVKSLGDIQMIVILAVVGGVLLLVVVAVVVLVIAM